MAWTIRRPVPGDGPRLRKIRLQALRDAPEAFRETYTHAAGLTPAEWESRVESYQQPGQQLLVVGEADGVWSGMAGAFVDHERDFTGITAPIHHRGRYATVWGMYTVPADRGQGLAEQLCSHACEWAALEAQVDWLSLDVRDSNTRAIRFYRRQGFQIVARQYHPEFQVTALVMLRSVSAP